MAEVFFFHAGNKLFLEGKKPIQPANNELGWLSGLLSVFILATMSIVPLWLNRESERDMDIAQQLDMRGVEADAEVISCTVGRPGLSIAYRYSLTNADGSQTSYRGRTGAPGQDCRNYGEGRRTAIFYLADAPHESQLAGARVPGNTSWVYVGLSAAFLVIGTAGLVNTVRDGLRRRSLTRQGVLLNGAIVSANLIPTRNGKVIEAEYRFMTPDGHERKQQQRSQTIMPPPAGTVVYVLYVHDALYRAL